MIHRIPFTRYLYDVLYSANWDNLIFKFVPCILIYSKFFIHQLMHKWIVLNVILKFTLKQFRHVSVQSHHHQGAHYSCLLKLQLLKQSIQIYRCVVNTVVVWLHICSHTTTVLTTHRCIWIDMQPHHHCINHTPMYLNWHAATPPPY